jgi:hypothetical protein
VHPGLLATAFRDRCNTRVFWEFLGGGEACSWFAEGDEEPGSEHGSGPWQGVKPRAVGMVLGALCHSGIEVGTGWQRDAELGHEGWHQENIGGDDTVIGGERDGTRDGLEAGINDVNRAHVVSPKEPVQGRAARQLRGFEGGPGAEEVTNDRRLFVGQPLQDLGKVVFAGTGQAIWTTDVVTDQAPAVFDEWGEGTHGGALGLQGLQLITGCEEEFDLKCRSGGVVFGSARGQRVAVPGHGERIAGKAPEAIIWAPCRHHGPFLEFQAHRDRASLEARAQGLDPRVDGFRAVVEAQERTLCSASGLSADIVFGIGPIEPDNGGKFFLR